MNAQASQRRPVAVFDFDKTLINTDVAYLFLHAAVRRQRIRHLAAGLLLPLLLPFFVTRRSRTVAMSVIMWIATFPLRGRTAADIFGAFAPTVFAPPVNGRFFAEGLAALAAHRQQGHRLLIVSGSPESLVRAVAGTHLGDGIDILGTRLVPFLGGLVYQHYCMGAGKIILARREGRLEGRWDYGYTDSALDIPLLAHCHRRHLINADRKTVRKVKAALGDSVTMLQWQQPADLAG